MRPFAKLIIAIIVAIKLATAEVFEDPSQPSDGSDSITL
jgi:hypothetical protein